MNEASKVAEYIYTTLSQDPTIQGIVGKHPSLGTWQIYEVHHPKDAKYPLIVFMPQTATMMRGTGGHKILRRCQYIIKAICMGDSFAPLASITNRIDVLFHRDQVNDDDEFVAGCSVVSDLQYTTMEDGVRYNHQGSIVEILAYGKEG